MLKRKRKKKENSAFKWMMLLLVVVVGMAVNWYVKNDNEGKRLLNIVQNESKKVQGDIIERLNEDVKNAGGKVRDVLLDRESYMVCFNTATRCPNYVAWLIDEKRLEKNVKRSDNFMEDMQVADNHRIIYSDYSRPGYDRGHMCPAADNRYSQVAMDECFLMTNMCPQTHTLNAGAWNDLEERCREWGKIYDRVYVVSGPIFTSDKPKKIGQRKRFKIAVPDKFFKVVLLEKNGEYNALGYVMNNNDDNRPLEDYAVTVDEVEKMTWMDFFHALPDDIEEKVEKEINVLE